MLTTSESLLLRLRRPGEAEAWTQFVRTYSPILYGWACRKGLSEADAADLVQDVFAILVQRLPHFTYEPHRRFRNWLWTVMHHRLIRLRSRRAEPVSEFDLTQVAYEPTVSAEEDEFRRYVIARLVPSMQEHFQPSTWRAFWALVVEGKTAPQTASELGISADAVYKAKLRVLARLQTEFADLLPD